jgi:transposase InsO family protein
MISECQAKCGKTYGYRRVHLWLMREKSLYCNPKTVLSVMNKYGLLSEIRRRKKYRYMGQELHKYENLLNRNFIADRPNVKWVTDISYIHTGQGVLYLSMIRDLYDNSIIAYKTGTEKAVNLVLNTIKAAIQKEADAVGVQRHSVQGFQYTSQAYFSLTQQYCITPSMSRRGNCYDNAMAENFFSILKTECIYRHKLETFDVARQLIDEYIDFYNNVRIQTKTGLTPLEKRCQAA